MMTRPFLLLMLLAALRLFAQTPAQTLQKGQEGAMPIPNAALRSATTGQSIRAVVVGISDYQHTAIPDLKYADRDAEAFAGWLRSSAAGSVPDANVAVLLNDKATAAQVISALDGLVESCNAGDLAILYFSGHGDIERATNRQNGYLLCHDAPATTYPAGGCLPLGYLQDIVSTISEKKAQVIVITDACHAGKLAGSGANGVQTTNAALARQFANEVKIMSCQPSEFSLEGAQWGGGRGVFSYHLLDGLTGLADRNTDGAVNLFEIGRYLEDHVTAEAAPHAQTPFVLGERSFTVAHVDAASLAELLKNKQSAAQPQLTRTDMKGFSEALLADSDSATQRIYRAFLAALERRDFLEPRGACADDYFEQLQQNEQLKPLHSLLRRNYAAALQDEIQQAINALLDNDPYEGNNWQYHPEKYARYPEYLKRAIELLGESHYMYRSLMSKKRYFEGYNLAKTLAATEVQPARRDSLVAAAKRLYLEGIEFEPEAAYLYDAIGDLYWANNPYQTDSLVLWCSRAVERSPGWVTPLLRIHTEYASMESDMEEADRWLQRALQILPNSYLVQEKLGFLRFYQKRDDEAIAVAQKMIDEKPDLFNAYVILVFVQYFEKGDFAAVEASALQSVERNPSPNNWAVNFWSLCYAYLHPGPAAVPWIRRQLEGSTESQRGYRAAALVDALGLAGQYEAAEQAAQQYLAEKLTPFTQTCILHMLGKVQMAQNRLPEAIAAFEKSLASDPTPNPMFINDFAWLGEIASRQGRYAAADSLYQQAIDYKSGFGEERSHKEEAWYLYGKSYLRQNRLREAGAAFQKALDMRPKGFWGEYGFALLAARNGKTREALDWLEKALDNCFGDARAIYQEPLFKSLRKTKRFNAMMAKHFPPAWGSE